MCEITHSLEIERGGEGHNPKNPDFSQSAGKGSGQERSVWSAVSIFGLGGEFPGGFPGVGGFGYVSSAVRRNRGPKSALFSQASHPVSSGPHSVRLWPLLKRLCSPQGTRTGEN